MLFLQLLEFYKSMSVCGQRWTFSQEDIYILILLESKFSSYHLKTLSFILVISLTSAIRNPYLSCCGPFTVSTGGPKHPVGVAVTQSQESGFHAPEHRTPGPSVSGKLSDGF